MTSPIAIVGMACRYPDASSPGELWENVLAQRRAFREMPAERMRREDYFALERTAADRTYALEAAVIEGYEFDRVKFKVVGSTYRSADLAHWLALDIAARALDDAGFSDAHGLPRDSTGVVLGNTLTGEFSRAGLMRYRWPYVRRTVDAALEQEGWASEKRAAFLAEMEAKYKAPFAPVGEESLAGGLSNTIAGRICNHFNLKGGGYTIDGACASSLLAIANACSALSAGDIDVALAGGVDLSLDPFEIIGFAKAGALAADEMRVYDVRSAGFWPGEGCGFVVLMRHDEALAQGRRIYALIRGWGVSSDGSGGITRPEEEGQLLAVHRAYRRSGFGPDSLAYFEGHGTGTTVGDTTELRTLSRAREMAAARNNNRPDCSNRREEVADLRQSRQTPDQQPPHVGCYDSPPAAIGSIKANIGHTKAAAGAAGFIKATMAVYTQVLPPTTGCSKPHAQIAEAGSNLRVLTQPQLWPAQSPLRAAVSAMGFGGINTHVVVEGVTAERRRTFTERERTLTRSAQDAELFLVAGATVAELQTQVTQLSSFAARLSRAELGDVAAALSRNLKRGTVRAAIAASTPAEFATRLKTLTSWLETGAATRIDSQSGIFLGNSESAPAIGFAFPGQGSPSYTDGGTHRRRFSTVADLYATNPLPHATDTVATAVAQPAIVTASMAGLRLLRSLGIHAVVGVGHSLGELTALHWAGAMDEAALFRVATARGKAMADLGSPTGAMAGIQADQRQVESLLNGELVVVAGLNSPRQTVISGPAKEVAAVCSRAEAAGVRATKLPVSHAFHSAHVAAATPALARHLSTESFSQLQYPVASTITGSMLPRDEDLRALLCRQVTSPVRFIEAISNAMHFVAGASHIVSEGRVTTSPRGIDLWIEVGPGTVLSGLIGDTIDTPVISLDTGGSSLRGLLHAVGAVFALGGHINHSALFEDRFTRPFNLDWKPKFFANPCESAPTLETPLLPISGPSANVAADVNRQDATPTPAERDNRLAACTPRSALEILRELVAQRAELPASAIREDSKLLGDLHLNSISVGQLVAEAARRLNLKPPSALNEFANASVGQVAAALEEMLRTGVPSRSQEVERFPAGVAPWIRCFTTEYVDVPSSTVAARPAGLDPLPGRWQIFAPANHPLANGLPSILNTLGGAGVVVCLPPGEPQWPNSNSERSECVRLLLAGAKAMLSSKEQSRFVVVQHGWKAGGFARTFHLESAPLATLIITLPLKHPDAEKWLAHEISVARGFCEVLYDDNGTRRQPRLRLIDKLPGSGTACPPDEGSGTACPMDQPSTTNSQPSTNPSIRVHSCSSVVNSTLTPDDVLLVTGGGKGIAAECALAMARDSGVKLAIVGRSSPDKDAELAANLERLRAAQAQFGYFAADVVDPDAVKAAVRAAEQQLGPITAVLHGAGTNVPKLIGGLDANDFQRTIAPKIDGLQNVIAAIAPQRLRVLVTFSSIIGRGGLRGEADYALANEWLSLFTEQFQRDHPQCHCLALEWSVWSGVGMGQRLGRVEALLNEGITPIPPDTGVDMLLKLQRRARARPSSSSSGSGTACPPDEPPVSTVITGRFGDLPTLGLERPELPFFRFLDKPRVFYPGIEMVVDVELSSATDPYVEDHIYRGERLFPAVMGLEAMAQVSMTLANSATQPEFQDVEFHRPIIVPRDGKTILRIAALRHESGDIEVVLRSETTGFQVDHFRARCRFQTVAVGVNPQSTEGNSSTQRPRSTFALPLSGSRALAPLSETSSIRVHPSSSVVAASRESAVVDSIIPLDVVSEVYPQLLFHVGRFQRLRNYRLLRAKECIAQIDIKPTETWFGRYLPQGLALGDPGARDAAIHAIQACIPHKRLLPTGVERIIRFGAPPLGGQPVFVHARERSHQGDLFIYDCQLITSTGEVIEQWDGLRLRVVEPIERRQPWPEPLLACYLERRLEELVPDWNGSVSLGNGTLPALLSADHPEHRLSRRPDGKPELFPTHDAAGSAPTLNQFESSSSSDRGQPVPAISTSHSGDLTLAIVSEIRVHPCSSVVDSMLARSQSIGCDIEEISSRPWQDLLGPERLRLASLLASENSEHLDVAATRVWTAIESMKKAGCIFDAPLVLDRRESDNWILLRSGEQLIASYVTHRRHSSAPQAIGFLISSPAS